jgi:predicted nucleic-acid-binding protein
MRAIDTNIAVRLFVRDAPVQVKAAEAFVSEPFLLLPTVLLEVIWVLESSYQLPRQEILEKTRGLLGMDTIWFASSADMVWVLDTYESGADFADALHIALAAEAEATVFATFDKRLARLSDALVVVEVAA